MAVLLWFERGSPSHENGASLSRQCFASHGFVSMMFKKPTPVSPNPPLRKGGKGTAPGLLIVSPSEVGFGGVDSHRPGVCATQSLTALGERADFSHNGKRVLFV